MIAPDTIRSLVAEAALAPNVHNVQPARWRIETDGATLFEDRGRRLPAADPRGYDAAISLGAAAEGFRLAAGRAGLSAIAELPEGDVGSNLRPVMRYRLAQGGMADPLAQTVLSRQSWRGAFQAVTDADHRAADQLAADDAAVITETTALGEAARWLDAASWRFMVDDAFRRELLSWMRLSRRHPDWARDGLNAEAMAMGGLEAFGAGIVLGRAFKPLKSVGLAKLLLAEGGKVKQAAAVVLFHRPVGEDPFVSGGHFYRLWLRIEAAGFAASVLAALADDREAATWASQAAGLPEGRRLVSAFRIGRRPAGASPAARARLPLDELIVSPR